MRLTARMTRGAGALCVTVVVGACSTGHSIAPSAQPSSTAAPSDSVAGTPSTPPLADGPLAAGAYYVSTLCCDAPDTAPILITFTVPEGWAGLADGSTIWLGDGGAAPPGGASIAFQSGAGLANDPCAEAGADIPVGSSADDFVRALGDHPLLEVTTPVDVTLGGYSGTYMDLQVPADLAECQYFRPWDPGFYAQGPGQRWHLWILDVDGMRVVVNSADYAETSPQHQDELQAIVDSIQIEP